MSWRFSKFLPSRECLKVVAATADVLGSNAHYQVGIRIMYTKREARLRGLLPVYLSGHDRNGKKFRQLAYTLNISRDGARLMGVQHALKKGSLVQLQYHQENGRFEVIWTRKVPKHTEWQVGLRCLEPDKRFWMLELGCGLDPECSRDLLSQVLANFRS